MENKITKKNSIYFNQLWINKAIEDGNSHLLIYKKDPNKSIGEVIEAAYLEEDLESKTPKVTRNNSLLFQREWLIKFREENLPLPKRAVPTKYSLGEILYFMDFKREMIERFKEDEKEKALKLK